VDSIENQRDNRSWPITLTALSLSYGFLSKAFYQPPDRDFLERLIANDLLKDFPLNVDRPSLANGIKIMGNFLDCASEDLQGETLSELIWDYHRLFVGPGHLYAPPWESVYRSREHLVFESQTLEIRSWYRRFGLQAPRLNKEPDDHIGLEFAFLLHLCTLALQSQADEQGFKRLLDAQRMFLEAHLLKWGPELFRSVIHSAETDYFRGLGFLAQGVLDEAVSIFGISILEKETNGRFI
jgi:TorA maturation chaperone TorD